MNKNQQIDYASMSFFRQFSILIVKLQRKHRWQLLGVLLLAIVSSVLEAFSIGALLPFLGLLTGSEHANTFISPDDPLVLFFPMVQGERTITVVTAVLVAALILAAAARIASTWVHARVTQVIGTEICTTIYRRILHQPYLRHVSRNSSEVVAALTGKAGTVVSGVIAPTLVLVQSVTISSAIIITLLNVNLVVTGLIIVSFSLLYGVLIATTKGRLTSYGVRISDLSNEVIKLLQESLGGIRDVLIDGSQEVYLKRFGESSNALRRVQANIAIISTSPAYVVVTLGMVALSIIGACFMVRDGSAATALPLLGAFALGSQRLLGNLQQTYSCWSVIRSSRQSFVDILKLYDEPAEMEAGAKAPLPYRKSIELSNISFCYPGRDSSVLSDFFLKIDHGQRVGIFGVTGGGKSTVLDILMGLLPPTKGDLKIDDIAICVDQQPAWRRNIAHVPQVIHLIDGSVLENIALGVPLHEIDMNRVRQAANGAQIETTIMSWPSGFHTSVGERGVRLSGGQRQRIGIARALYKRASVVVFDEATSALDSETETGVIDALNAFGRDITLIMVAHRLTTLRQCDVIYEISGGKISRKGTYEELFAQPPSTDDCRK